MVSWEKKIRIRKRTDFIRVSQAGFCSRTGSFIVQCCFNNLEIYRIGITASKKVGNAVVRNRCKRRMRAVASIVFNENGLNGVDYVLIAKRSVFNIKWNDLVGETIYAVRFLNRKILKCKNFGLV